MKATNMLLLLLVFAVLAFMPIAAAEEITASTEITGAVTGVEANTSTGAEVTTTSEPTQTTEPAETTEPAQTGNETETNTTETNATEATNPQQTTEVTPTQASQVVAEAGVPTVEQPSITPDSPFWGLKNALSRIQYLISFGKASKAKTGLRIAEEHHKEALLMMAEKKFDAAAKAEAERQKTLAEVKANVDAISESDPQKESELEDELAADVKTQDDQTTKFNSVMKLKYSGTLTDDQQAKLDETIAALKASNADVQVTIKEKKKKTEVKIKVRSSEKKSSESDGNNTEGNQTDDSTAKQRSDVKETAKGKGKNKGE